MCYIGLYFDSFRMVLLELIGRTFTSFVPHVVDKGDRARRLVSGMRTACGIWDPVHGRTEDIRPLPSARTLGFMMELDRVERVLKRIIVG